MPAVGSGSLQERRARRPRGAACYRAGAQAGFSPVETLVAAVIFLLVMVVVLFNLTRATGIRTAAQSVACSADTETVRAAVVIFSRDFSSGADDAGRTLRTGSMFEGSPSDLDILFADGYISQPKSACSSLVLVRTDDGPGGLDITAT